MAKNGATQIAEIVQKNREIGKSNLGVRYQICYLLLLYMPYVYNIALGFALGGGG